MKKEVHKQIKPLHKRASWLAMVLVGILCISLAAFIPDTKVEAYDEVNDIAVTVGYWGGADYTKKEVSLSELAGACGVNEAVYTWVNAGYSPGTTEARGIYLYDIMQYCGIDMNSVYYYNFYTNDGATYGGARQQWTSDQLFATRYTFAPSFNRIIDDYYNDPDDVEANPERHFTLNNVFDYTKSEYTSTAWNSRETVEPMLALETRSASWRGYTPGSDLDFSSLSTTGRPILMFGQAGRNDITRNLHAQMVFQIHIWFKGSPTVTLKATDLSGKVGSTKTVQVNVTTPDAFLSQKVLEQVQLTSSDTSIAEVAADGTVTFKGEGAATITATYDGKVVGTVTATGTGQDDDSQDDSGKGSGNGSGSSAGDGSGSGSGKNNGTGAGTGSGTRSTQGRGSAIATSNSARRPGASQSRLSTAGNRSAARPSATASRDGSQQAGSAGGSASGSGDHDQTVYEISQAAEQLAQPPTTNRLFKWVMLVVGLALLAGATGQATVYRNEVAWVKRAKKAYEQT